MNAKSYLLRYKKYKDRVNRYKDRIAQLEDTMKGVNLDGMPRGGSLSDPTQIAALNLTLLKEQLGFSIVEAERLCQKIVDEINSMENPQYSELLYSRYILLLPWVEVAERLRARRHKEYDIKYVMGEMHGRALQAFAEVIK